MAYRRWRQRTLLLSVGDGRDGRVRVCEREKKGEETRQEAKSKECYLLLTAMGSWWCGVGWG